MDIKATPIKDKSQTEVEISISAQEFQPFLDQAAKKITKDKPLKGFRPGKAPLSVVCEAFGQDRVITEAVDAAIPHFFIQAVMDQDIEALGRPAVSISKASIEEGLQFTARVDVMPEITLGDPAKLTAERHSTEVTDEMLEKELKYLAKLRSTFLEVARPAEEGDTVVVDFKVSVSGAVIEGGESKNHPIHIGEGHFIPGFEDNIKGMTAGDTREFTLTFPNDFGREDLRGKETNIWVHAHAVQKRVVPEVNDDFARTLGKFTGLQNLKDEIRENLLKERVQKEQERLQGELAEKLTEVSSFGAIPDVLIEREIDHRLEEFSRMLSMQNQTIDMYLQRENKTVQQMRGDMRPSAERGVKVGLTIRAFAQAQNITPDDKEVEKQIAQFLGQFSSPEEAKQSVDEEDLRTHTVSRLRNEQALKRLEELATIKDIKEESSKIAKK